MHSSIFLGIKVHLSANKAQPMQTHMCLRMYTYDVFVEKQYTNR